MEIVPSRRRCRLGLSPCLHPLQLAPWPRPLDPVTGWEGPAEASCHIAHLTDEEAEPGRGELHRATQVSGSVRAWTGLLGFPGSSCHVASLSATLPSCNPPWMTNHPQTPPPGAAVPPALETHIAVGAIIFAPLDLVQGGVREVEFLGTVVNGQAVGRADVLLDESQGVGSRQGCSHDARVLLVPVGPEH